MKFIHIILFSLLFSLTILAQGNPAVSKGTIKFYVDYSCFKGSGNETVVETYVMLYADQLKYTRTNDKEIADYKVNAVIKDAENKVVKEQTWTTRVDQQSVAANLKNYAVYDQWRADLIPGKYKISFEIKDVNSNGNGTAETILDIPDFNINNYSLSQLEFVNSIETVTGTSVFSKGNNKIIPNPSRRYGVLSPILYLYYEIYNIPQNSNGNLIVNYSILDKNNNLVKQYPSTSKEKKNSDAAVINGVDVSQIPTGIYKFRITVNDTSAKRSAETEKYFEIVQMDYVNNNPAFTEEQAETAGKQIKYFATPREMEIYNNLDLNGKAQFLIEFWREKEPTPGTKKNEFLEKVQQRFQYANENFGTNTVEGWASDRGRILIKYGKPDDIDRHHFETGTVPYEIWSYKDQKSYEFVFADLYSNGNYVLLHSTKEGEVSNDNWQEYIKKM